MSKPNIKQLIKDRQQNTPRSIPSNKPSMSSFMDSPLFMMAKSAIPNLPPKIKYALALIIYLLGMGVVGTIYFSIKLMQLF